MEVVQKICDRVAVMEAGEIVEIGRSMIYFRAKTPVNKGICEFGTFLNFT